MLRGRPKNNEPTSLAREDLRQSVDNLTSFATPIKVAISVPEAARTPDTSSKVNRQAVRPAPPVTSEQFPYVLLKEPLPGSWVPELLGGVVDPDKLSDLGGDPIPSSILVPTFATLDDFSEVAVDSGMSNPSLLYKTKYDSSAARPTTVKRWQLRDPKVFMAKHLESHGRKILQGIFKASPDANIAMVSTTLTFSVQPTKTLSGSETRSSTGEGEAVHHSLLEISENSESTEQIFAFSCFKISRRDMDRPTVKILKHAGPGYALRVYHLALDAYALAVPEGPVELGSIITDLKNLRDPLNTGSVVPVPGDQIYTAYNADYYMTETKSATAWSKVMGRLVSGSTGGSIFTGYQIDRLETIQFRPTTEYVTQSIEHEDVHKYLRSGSGRSVYLITGLKIIRGAALIQEGRTQRVHVSLAVDAPISAPAALGVGGRTLRDVQSSKSLQSSDDFIFAVRLQQIRCKRRFFGTFESVMIEDYTQGAMF